LLTIYIYTLIKLYDRIHNNTTFISGFLLLVTDSVIAIKAERFYVNLTNILPVNYELYFYKNYL